MTNTQRNNELNGLGQRVVTFLHEDGTDTISIMPEYNQSWLNMMRQYADADGLDLILNPTFKSQNGHWKMDEMEVLSSIIVFVEKIKVKTSYGSEGFKNEELAAYDTIGGMIKKGDDLDLAKRLFSKLFPKLSFNNVYAHLI
jgi:hypothetical protein